MPLTRLPLKGPLDELLVSGFLEKPVFPSTEDIRDKLEAEVQEIARLFYRITHDLIRRENRRIPTAQDLVLSGFATLKRQTHAKISRSVSEAEQQTFDCFVALSRKYLLGGLMGRPSTSSDAERYVLKVLSVNPKHYLRLPDVVAFIASRCLAGDVLFFRRLGRELADNRERIVTPSDKLDYAICWYWTFPLMPLWMMTDEAGSKALSFAIDKPVQRGAYEKVRKALRLPAFPKRAIREVKSFRNGKLEYVYSAWVPSRKKG